MDFALCMCVCAEPRHQIYLGNKSVKIFSEIYKRAHEAPVRMCMCIRTHFQSPSSLPSRPHLPEIKTSILPRRTRDGAGRLQGANREKEEK